MTVDLDTICETLHSPMVWAETAAMPEARAHFQTVVMNTPDTKMTKPISTQPLAFDMTRAASELNY